MLRTALLALLLPLAPVFAPAMDAAQAAPYGAVARLDLAAILPPVPDAAETRRELDALLVQQKSRTPEQAAACRADQEISVFRFIDVLGEGFTADALPKTAVLFARVLTSEKGPLERAKAAFARPRPPAQDPAIRPCVDLPPNAAYPSGHATAGNLMATVLAAMVPEKAAELHRRGRAFGDHRVQGGVHFPSDVDAGRLCAAAIAAELFQDTEFKADFAAARAEVRAHMGLKP